MPTEIEVLKRYQRGKASAPFRSRFFLDLVNHEWFLLLFSWLFFLEHIVLLQVFLFSKFFWSIFFFRAPGSDPRWSGVDSNLCVLKFHSPGAWPPPKVPTKKIPNTTQLLVNDGKHYFRVGSLSSNFKSLENGPAVPTQKTTPFLLFFWGPRGPEVRSFCGGFMFYFNHAFAPRLFRAFLTSAKRTRGTRSRFFR